ncbi:MAG: hypothetical protein AAFP76_05640 [Bacteroidota bacterium]
MSKWLVIVEKMIAGLLILLGVYGIISLIGIWGHYNANHVVGEWFNMFDFVRVHLLEFVIVGLSILAGVLLLLQKPLGWILSLSINLIYIIHFIYLFFFSPLRSRVITSGGFMEDVQQVLLIVFALAIFFILTLKRFRKKYQPNRKLYILGIGIVLLFSSLKTLNVIRERRFQQQMDEIIHKSIEDSNF